MPKSKQRKHHHDQHKSGGSLEHAKKSRSAVTVTVIFCALLGMGSAYFASGVSALWLAIGAAVGALVGYFFGKQIDKSVSDK